MKKMKKMEKMELADLDRYMHILFKHYVRFKCPDCNKKMIIELAHLFYDGICPECGNIGIRFTDQRVVDIPVEEQLANMEPFPIVQEKKGPYGKLAVYPVKIRRPDTKRKK